jgi:hypothetical protein
MKILRLGPFYADLSLTATEASYRSKHLKPFCYLKIFRLTVHGPDNSELNLNLVELILKRRCCWQFLIYFLETKVLLVCACKMKIHEKSLSFKDFVTKKNNGLR